MNLKEKLETLWMYYDTVRPCGHTKLVREGTNIFDDNDLDYRVVVPYVHFGMNNWPHKWILWDQIDDLRGRRVPIAFDNSAILQLVKDCLDTIEEKDREIKRLQDSARVSDSWMGLHG